jgi:hypothetical protein
MNRSLGKGWHLVYRNPTSKLHNMHNQAQICNRWGKDNQHTVPSTRQAINNYYLQSGWRNLRKIEPSAIFQNQGLQRVGCDWLNFTTAIVQPQILQRAAHWPNMFHEMVIQKYMAEMQPFETPIAGSQSNIPTGTTVGGVAQPM